MLEIERCGKFCRKLLSEVVLLGAEQIDFSLKNEQLEISVKRAAQTIKVIQLKSVWLERSLEWFWQRRSVFSGIGLSENWPTERTFFSSAVRLGGQLLVFDVNADDGLQLKNFQLLSLTDALKNFDLVDASEIILQKLLGLGRGIVVVAGSDSRSAEKSRAAFLSISEANYLCSLVELTKNPDFYTANENSSLCVSHISNDLLEALQQIYKDQRLAGLPIEGIVIQNIVERVCPQCSQPQATGDTHAKDLPVRLRALAPNQCLAKGCQSCGQRGYKGELAIQSLLFIDPFLKAALRKGQNQSELAGLIYRRGAKPLIEDALRKVGLGFTTLDVVNNRIPKLAEAYKEVYKALDELPIPVPDTTQESQALQGRAVIRGKEGDDVARKKTESSNQKYILVVEDDRDQQHILEMVLKAADFEVQLASDGAAALKLLKNKKPDLILTDLMMPGMDGVQFVEELKKNPNYRKIPILVLTVIADAEKEYQLLNLGVDDYCEKHTQRRVLLKRIENLVGRE